MGDKKCLMQSYWLHISCCSLCWCQPQAIDGNTWAVSIWCQFQQWWGERWGRGRGRGGTRTWMAVLLMGHLDVWAYVIQSQRAASNRSSTAGTKLRDNRSAASLLHPGGHGSGNRSRQGPEASLSLSTSTSSNTHTVSTQTHKLNTHYPTAFCSSWPDLDLSLGNQPENFENRGRATYEGREEKWKCRARVHLLLVFFHCLAQEENSTGVAKMTNKTSIIWVIAII